MVYQCVDCQKEILSLLLICIQWGFDLDRRDPAFHHAGTKVLIIHKGAFDASKIDLCFQSSCFFKISGQYLRRAIRAGAVKRVCQRLSACQCVADALKGAGTDEARRLSEKKGSAFALVYASVQLGAGYETSLSAFGKIEACLIYKSLRDQLLLLRFECLAAVFDIKRAAKDHLAVLEKDPGATCGRGVVKNAGIVGVLVTRRKPLLDRYVFVELFVFKQR